MAAHNKLTQKQIEAAKADGKQSKLADGGGLYLLLHPNGSKYWRMRYRHGGCEKTLALGVYPAVSLKQARELARAARAQTARWQDIDLTARLWHIPAADMKTKHPFTVPLSDWAVEILRELHTQTGDNIHLFPGIRPRRKPAPHPDHISIKFAHNAIRRLGYDGSTPANPNTPCTDSATSSPTSA
ncbi:integrase family protein [Neisseria gonorrhoeae]